MFDGVSKGKLFKWSVFFAAFFLMCWQWNDLIPRALALIFLLVVIVMVSAIYRKFSHDHRYKVAARYTDDPALLLDTSETSPESAYFGPWPPTK